MDSAESASPALRRSTAITTMFSRFLELSCAIAGTARSTIDMYIKKFLNR